MQCGVKGTGLGRVILTAVVFAFSCASAAAATPPDRSERLEQFRRQKIRRSGAEFERPTDAVIDEMLAERNRPVLDMLCDVLAAKTLEDKQVERLIAAAKASSSDAHRPYLWRVLYGSQSKEATQYLIKAVVEDADDEAVMALLGLLDRSDPFNAVFMTKIYEQRKAELIRGLLLTMTCDRSFFSRSEASQTLLLRWIVEHDEDVTRRVTALTGAALRAGVNRDGDRLLQDTLREEQSPEFRKAVFAVLMARRGDSFLDRLLSGRESEEVILAGLDAYHDSILASRALIPVREAVPASLRRAGQKSESQSVRRAIDGILATFRDREVNRLVELFRQERRSISRTLTAIGAGGDGLSRVLAGVPGLEARFRHLGSSDAVADNLKVIRDKFGTFADEKAQQARIEQELDAYQTAMKKLTELARTAKKNTPAKLRSDVPARP